jgi:hypothetical protein
MRIVFDTNILIDFLNGIEQAKTELSTFSDKYISRITWLEVLAEARDASEETMLKSFLRGFKLQEVDHQVCEIALKIRKESSIKLPDCIILASARNLGCQLATRNTKDFDADSPEIRIPYSLID